MFLFNLDCDHLMRKIEAVVRNSKLFDIQEALHEIGIPSFSTYEVKIGGIHPGHSTWRHKHTKSSDFLPKTKNEILCGDQDEQKIVETLSSAAHTGETGDGIVFVYPIDQVHKIKTGDTDESAI